MTSSEKWRWLNSSGIGAIIGGIFSILAVIVTALITREVVRENDKEDIFSVRVDGDENHLIHELREMKFTLIRPRELGIDIQVNSGKEYTLTYGDRIPLENRPDCKLSLRPKVTDTIFQLSLQCIPVK